jgi:hypothetical protein
MRCHGKAEALCVAASASLTRIAGSLQSTLCARFVSMGLGRTRGWRAFVKAVRNGALHT